MKYLASEADARWEAKPRLVDAPGKAMGQPVAALESQAARRNPSTQGTQSQEQSTQRDAIASAPEQEQSLQRAQKDPAKEDPWKQRQRGGPSEAWQPDAWTPPPAPKKR